MQITSPFKRLNRKAINAKEKSATERLHDENRKMFKSDTCILYCDEEPPTISN